MQEPTLGILVNSNRHLEIVAQLAKAAKDKGSGVKIHFLGRGTDALANSALFPISHRVQMSVCSISLDNNASNCVDVLPQHVSIVSPERMIRIVEECDRVLIL